VQGTIKDFDEETRTGTLLTDDRAEIGIDARSIETDTIRMLRIGQRVAFDVVEDAGRTIARRLHLVTVA
jgi:2-phospho-L-lactate/phosphoenolpyruvate guanylyltransferase